FCYWVMDLNPDEAVAAGWLRAGSFAGWALERMSRFSLRRADQIIALDPFMRDRIIAQGIAREKIAVIPPWAHDDQVRFDAAGREKFRQAHEMRDKFVVMYAGNHSPVHPLDTLMQAADALKNDGSMLFCFMGGGSEFKRVQRWAAEGKRANVLCLPYRPLNEMSSALSAADAHVVVMGSAMPGLVHPCKIYNILAVNAPVIYIGPRPSHVTEILEGPGMNHPWASVQHGEAQALARQIQELRRNINGSSSLPANERVAAYSKKVLLPNLMLVLEECPTRPIN
ncbi:MAG: glycosyltransferase family 4 protein, partial [Limisphaerales bacterium]